MAIKEEIKDESVEVVEATVEADETKLAEGSETNTESVDAEEVVEETEEEKVEDQDNEPESVDAENVVEETVLSANDPRAELRQFVELFGKEKGSEYYLDGVELSDAKNKYIEELKSENEKLKSVNELGEAEPVSTTKLTNEIKDNFSTVMNSYKTK